MMKKLNNNIIIAVFIVTVALTGASCKKQMTTLNTDPTALGGVPPQYLFANYTQDFNQNELGLNHNQVGITNFFLQYMQYATADVATAQALEAPYWSPNISVGSVTTNNPQQDYYDDYYTTYGYAMHLIEQNIEAMPSAEQATYANLKAICQVVDTYEAWRVMDIYGAMPYSQAFQPNKYEFPAYDYEQTLYKTFDSVLRAAATVLQTNGNSKNGQVALGSQDFFYGGDIPSWEAFANTLRIKIAQRYEKRDAANLTSVVTDISTNFGSAIISSNAQSFGVNNTQEYQNNEGGTSYIIDYDVSYAFAEFLKSTKDPRLPMMVRQNDFGTNDQDYNKIAATGTPATLATLDSLAALNNSRYWGKHAFAASANNPAYGWTGSTLFQSFPITAAPGSDELEYLSTLQTRLFIKNGGYINASYDVRTDTSRLHSDESVVNSTTIQMRTLFLTYAETCFMMAEIAQKGGGSALGQSAAQWYNAGVTASVQQYQTAGLAAGVPGADTVTIGDYLTRYPYNNTLQQIYSQEWVHLLVQPEEAWAMWKRTGYPQFVDYRPGQPTTPGNIGDGSGIAYLENLWDGSQNWTLSRRSSFNITDAGSSLNINNFDAALNEMLTFNPAYGTNGLDTRGRTWWDMQ